MPADHLNEALARLTALVEQRCGLGREIQRARLLAFLGTAPAIEQAMLADRLTHADAETPVWTSLVESLLVHETYFYRHPDQLAVFAREILPEVARARGATPLQIWCAGCATGEEAYTLAFLLRDAGCAARVLATDLSPESIAVARAARYRRSLGLGSFREMPPAAWRHFAPVAGEGDAFTVAPGIRGTVEFAVHNLMQPHPPGFAADVISCRNTLLYFGESGCRQAEATLVAAARPGTILLLGPAERLRHTDVFVPMTRSNPQILHWPR